MEIERLHELFHLVDGKLIRRVRVNYRALAGEEAGHVRRDGYRIVSIDGKNCMAHRLIFAMTRDRWPLFEIDHINGNRADNRPDNLREATSAENKFNSLKRKDNTSGHPGVNWDRIRSRWCARIRFNGERISLGYFRDIDAAAAAYRAAETRLHGQFARNC